ncbi:UNVERIFIED_CONTAM: hypothetical protein FKN15_056930 [Acipenser sinensis]
MEENAQPLFTFGVIADIQYADIEDGFNFLQTRKRYYRNSISLLNSATETWNAEPVQPSFILQLGDIIDGFNKPRKASEKALETVVNGFNKCKAKAHHAWGNHEFYNFSRDYLMDSVLNSKHLESTSEFQSAKHVEENNPEPSYSYHFSPAPNFRFVLLDAYDISIIGRGEPSRKYYQSLKYLREHNKNKNLNVPPEPTGMKQRFVEFNGGFSREQLDWLNDVLTFADNNQEKVTVMCNRKPPDPKQFHVGKRKALKLNFANPPIKSTARFTLNTSGVPFQNPHIERLRTHSIESSGKLKISPEQHWDFTAEDLKDLGEIGRGAYGSVNKMVHKPSGQIMAVKRIRSTVDEKEQKQLLMDLDVVMRSSDCPYIVQFYGALFREGDCWICMELMSTSFDKFYKYVYCALDDVIPEEILGKITLALKVCFSIADIKPSNILLDRNGNIKLCDFGISGQLVDSIAKTRDAGCRPYMAPERIDPSASRQGYDVRSDVWSLGITLYELATGRFPYPKWNSVFDQLTQVVKGEPPQLSNSEERQFSPMFINFVNLW